MVDERGPHPPEAPRPSPSLFVVGLDELFLVVVLLALLTALGVRLSSKTASRSANPSSMRIALSPDGSLLAATTVGGSGVYDLEMGRLLYLLPGDLCSLEFSRDNRMLLLADPEGAVSLRDARNGRRIRTWRAKIPSLKTARLHPGGDLVAAAGPSGPIELLAFDDAVPRRRIDTGLARILDFSYAEAVGLLEVIGADEASWYVIQLWDVRTARLQKTLPVPGLLEEGIAGLSFAGRGVAGGDIAAVSPDGSKVAMVLDSPPRLGLLDVPTGALSTQTPQGPSGSIRRIKFSRTGRYVFFEFGMGSHHYTTLWDLDEGGLKVGPRWDVGPTDVQFVDRDRTLASAVLFAKVDLRGEEVLFWNVDTAELLRKVEACVFR